MKVYVLIASDRYPKHHRLAGEETRFVNKMIAGSKKHTCRMNYAFWEKRAEEINAKRAYLSVRSWSGLPYRSTQDEYQRIVKLNLEHLDIIKQKIFINDNELSKAEMIQLAHNDGFENSEQGLKDFLQWLKADQKDIQDACVMHFTDLRYAKGVRKAK